MKRTARRISRWITVSNVQMLIVSTVKICKQCLQTALQLSTNHNYWHSLSAVPDDHSLTTLTNHISHQLSLASTNEQNTAGLHGLNLPYSPTLPPPVTVKQPKREISMSNKQKAMDGKTLSYYHSYRYYELKSHNPATFCNCFHNFLHTETVSSTSLITPTVFWDVTWQPLVADWLALLVTWLKLVLKRQ